MRAQRRRLGQASALTQHNGVIGVGSSLRSTQPRLQKPSQGDAKDAMAKTKDTVFGIAMRNFTKYPEMPSARGLVDYGVRMEELGYEVDLGLGPYPLGRRSQPIHEALAILTAVAARTSRSRSAPASWLCRCAIRCCWPRARHHRPHFRGTADRRRGGRLRVQARVRLARRRLPSARQGHGAVPGGHQPPVDERRRSTATIPLQAARRRALPKPVQKPRRRS